MHPGGGQGADAREFKGGGGVQDGGKLGENQIGTNTPHTLHPTPYTLHPTPYTPHPTPYTLHPTPYTLNQCLLLCALAGNRGRMGSSSNKLVVSKTAGTSDADRDRIAREVT